MNSQRHYTKLDQLCLGLDQALKSVFCHPDTTKRPNPAENIIGPDLTENQRKLSAALMRVNHSGEVCAQALYHGQGLVSQRENVRTKMETAAKEEGDHLAWCAQRIHELDSHTSYLNLLWYLGSFAIGVTAGLVGDEWSLGFLAETENQVVTHLENQLELLPEEDVRSAEILQQMQKDEAQHRQDAMQAGAAELPSLVKNLMRCVSRVMVKTSYWI